MNKDPSYTVSSVSANVAEDFSVTLELGAAKAEEVVALVSFSHPFDRKHHRCHCSCYGLMLYASKLH